MRQIPHNAWTGKYRMNDSTTDTSSALEVQGRVGTQGKSDYVDVVFLIRMLWRGKWLIMLSMVVGIALTVQDLRRHVPAYEAKTIIVPFEAQQASAGSATVSRIAQNLGLEVSSGDRGVSAFDRLELLLSSVRFAKLLQEKYGLLHIVYAGSWDAERQVWKRPEGRRFDLKQQIRAALHLRTWTEPDLESLASYVSSAIVIDKTGGKAVRTITFQHGDPEFAKWFLQTIYTEAEGMLRQFDRVQNLERKAYLGSQLANTSLVDIRKVLLALLEREERTSMLLSGSETYAAKVIEPVFVSSKPTAPSIVLTLVPNLVWCVGVALLLVLGYGLARKAS